MVKTTTTITVIIWPQGKGADMNMTGIRCGLPEGHPVQGERREDGEDHVALEGSIGQIDQVVPEGGLLVQEGGQLVQEGGQLVQEDGQLAQ